jgi:ABC-2 type transport system ATP-binding protein
VLVLEGLRKSYAKAAPAVDGLSLTVGRGEVFGLLGPNGAGKTTTVALIAGLLTPDEGRVDVDGLGSPRQAAARRRLGVAPQALALYDDLTGEENVALFGRVHGHRGEALRHRVAAALDFVGLRDRGRDRVATYSGGMKRRLNLAVALVHEPDLVLLDEPTVGVDPQSRALIFENIRALKRAGKAILYTTHYMEEAERLCDRVGIMDRGRLLASGSVPELLQAHGASRVLVAEVDGETRRIETGDPLAALLALTERERVDTFRVERPDLEQVFLHLTGRHLRD